MTLITTIVFKASRQRRPSHVYVSEACASEKSRLRERLPSCSGPSASRGRLPSFEERKRNLGSWSTRLYGVATRKLMNGTSRAAKNVVYPYEISTVDR